MGRTLPWPGVPRPGYGPAPTTTLEDSARTRKQGRALKNAITSGMDPGLSELVTTATAIRSSYCTLAPVPGDPLGVAASPDDRWPFAALSQRDSGFNPWAVPA